MWEGECLFPLSGCENVDPPLSLVYLFKDLPLHSSGQSGRGQFCLLVLHTDSDQTKH